MRPARLERVSTWDDPEQYARCVARSYRRDFWNQQPVRVEVWCEKGTVRGVLQPVLDQYAVGFRVMHGFGSATTIHDVCQDNDGRDLIVLYVGDYDPCGHVHVGGRPAQSARRVRWPSRNAQANCAYAGAM